MQSANHQPLPATVGQALRCIGALTRNGEVILCPIRKRVDRHDLRGQHSPVPGLDSRGAAG